jgi:hypothetical protein
MLMLCYCGHSVRTLNDKRKRWFGASVAIQRDQLVAPALLVERSRAAPD